MDSSCVQDLMLYVLNSVLIRLENGSEERGVILDVNEQSVTLDDGRMIPLDEVRDVEAVGMITDYHTYGGYGVFSSGYQFTFDDLVDDGAKDRVFYGEFDVEAACHLTQRDGKIRCVEVRVLSTRYRVNATLLAKAEHVYVYADGRCVRGSIDADGLHITTDTGAVSDAAPDQLMAVFRAPAVNMTVTVLRKNGETVCGVVTAVMQNRFAVRKADDSGMAVLTLEDVAGIWFAGSISVIADDKVRPTVLLDIDNDPARQHYLGKIPYFQTKVSADQLRSGMKVSFCPGVTQRGLIAKEIGLAEGVELAPAEPPQPVQTYTRKGIILYCKRNQMPAGHIGSVYITKPYAKMVYLAGGGEMPRGNVSFTMEQLTFPVTPDHIYVVSYTCSFDPDVRGGMVDSVTLETSYPYAEYAMVTVDAQQEVHALRTDFAYLEYISGLDQRDNRETELELTLADDTVLNCSLKELEAGWITVNTLHGQRSIDRSEIRAIRYFGVITSCREDCGYLNGSIFFHVNDLRSRSDAMEMNRNSVRSLAAYALRQSFTGNFLCGQDVTIYHMRFFRGYLVGFENGISTVVAPPDYDRPDARQSYPTLRLSSEAQAVISRINLSLFDYPVTLRLRISPSDNQKMVILESIDEFQPNVLRKRRFGYVVTYSAPNAHNAGYGFITPMDRIEDKLRDETLRCDTIFSPNNVARAPQDGFNTRQFYYLVSYELDLRNTIVEVKVLETLSKAAYQAKRQEQRSLHAPQAQPQPQPEQQPQTQILHDEVVPMEPLLEKEQGLYEHAPWQLGFINIATNNVGRVDPTFYNRAYYPTPTAGEEQSYGFEMARTTILFEGDNSFKTIRKTYVVRFVPSDVQSVNDAGQAMLHIDYAYPIQVLAEYPKSAVARLWFEGHDLHVMSIAARNYASEIQRTAGKDKTGALQPLINDESVIVCTQDNRELFCTYKKEQDSFYCGELNATLTHAEVSAVQRFGIVTALDITNGRGTINNTTEFSISTMELQAFNIAKSQQSMHIQLYVMYACNENSVTSVIRVPDTVLRRIPWNGGSVTSINLQQRQIIIDDAVTHHITVQTDGAVSRSVRDGSLNNQQIYCRKIAHPFVFEGSEDVALVLSAVEVRQTKENVTLRFDAGRNLLLAYRNATIYFVVADAVNHPELLDSQQSEIIFEIGLDNNVLEAHLLTGAKTEELDAVHVEEELEEPTGVSNSPLLRMLMEKADLRNIGLYSVALDDSGMPVDEAQAAKALNLLVRISANAESLLAMAEIIEHYPELELPIRGIRRDMSPTRKVDYLLRRALKQRCTVVGRSPDSSFGEHSCYLSLLLRYPYHKANVDYTLEDCQYRLFLQDFGTRDELRAYIERPMKAHPLDKLLMRKLNEDSMHNFAAHLVMLDRSSLETVLHIMVKNELLCTQLVDYVRDDGYSYTELQDLVTEMRQRYEDLRSSVFFRLSGIEQQDEPLEALHKLLVDISRGYAKLICRDDARRFEQLSTICHQISSCAQVYDGVTEQTAELKRLYRAVDELENEAVAHPCRESTDMLLARHRRLAGKPTAYAMVKRMLTQRLNALYANERLRPALDCYPNTPQLVKGQDKLLLLVSNGKEDSRFSVQTAEKLHLTLMPVTEGVSVTSNPELSRRSLRDRDLLEVMVDVVIEDENVREIELGWAVTFECAGSFEGGETNYVQLQQEGSLIVQVGGAGAYVKNIHVKNEYDKTETVLEDKYMFFGREAEMNAIKSSILTGSGSSRRLIPGRSVILYGQKKCGKTSMMCQITNDIRQDPNAIILDIRVMLDAIGGVDGFKKFHAMFYTYLLNRFRMEINQHHPDVVQMLKENDLQLPKPLQMSMWDSQTLISFFNAFFDSFRMLDREAHTVVLIMDEFTAFTHALLEKLPEDPSLATLLMFIKTFALQYGFVQLIIGHESMMRGLERLGMLNHTAEFSKKVELGPLRPAEAEDLIRTPMKRMFGYDPYNSPLGKRAVALLQDLSGCSPQFINKLCKLTFAYFTDPTRCPESQTHLLAGDIEQVVHDWLMTSDANTSFFDILIHEDGDEVGMIYEQQWTYRYLECAALQARTNYDHRTEEATVRRELMRRYPDCTEDQIQETCKLLEARRVIRIENGRVRILNGLFLRFIWHKYGSN